MGRRIRPDEPGRDRPFIDSGGFTGSRYVDRESTIRKIASRKGQAIQFELLNDKFIRLVVPDMKPIRVSNDNAIRLAYWILDRCR